MSKPNIDKKPNWNGVIAIVLMCILAFAIKCNDSYNGSELKNLTNKIHLIKK